MTDRSLVGSDQPPLEQGDHAVNPWHQLRWSLLLPFEKSDLVLVALVLQGQVPQPAVGVDDAAGCDRILHKWNQAFGRSVQNLAHANSTESRSIFLSGNNDQSFLQIESAGQSLFQAADIAFIHFDSAGEQITSRSYHGAAQFMQHRPGCLIFFQPQHSLQSQRAGPVLLRGHPPHRAKPHGQRNACVLEDRSGRHRSLAPTCRTLPQTPHRPRFLRLAAGTTETGRPPKSRQVRPTRIFGGEVRLQLHQITRILFHHHRILDIGLT